MPYSINKPNGYISYDVAAKLDIPWRTDLRDFKSLTVYRREDLTFYPNSGMPLTHEKIAYFCCTFSCNTNQLTMTMHLPKLGFIAGERIPVNITLVNESNTDIRGTTLTLRRIFDFYVKSYTKQKIEDLAFITCEGVKRRSRATFDAEVVVPKTLLYTRYCESIKVSYRLDLRADTNGFFTTSHLLKTPILVGHIGHRTV